MTNFDKQSYLISRFVILMAVLFAVVLGIAIWNMNPWPTDAEVYYMPAALRIPYIHYLSQIHVTEGMEHVRWLHGKEFYVATISLFQFLMNDFTSLRPLLLIGLVSIAVSTILIFYIARRFWGEWIALWCSLSFALCLWPYIYILFAKHQTLGLMLFLIAVVFLLRTTQLRWRPLWYFLSGLSIGLALFSSTVSTLYLPYYAAVFFFILSSIKHGNWKNYFKVLVGSGLMVSAGFACVFIYVNLPDIFLNVRNFAEYVHISGAFNHFYYNQPALQQFFPHLNVGEARGGWIWIFKYLFLILPILFPLYLSAVFYLCWRIFKEAQWQKRLTIAGVILLSLSSPILAEIAQVAQYGANYFPTLIGILALICYALADSSQRIDFQNSQLKTRLRNIFLAFIALHGAVNLYIFIDDVYIPRMATAFLSDKLKAMNVDLLATYKVHFHRNHFVPCLNAELRKQIRWVGMKSLGQLDQGYAIVPPPAGDSIYIASSGTYNNFDKDPVLVQLIRKHLLPECAVASYKTLVNSHIWQQEEEILSYRDLILGHKFPDPLLGRVWVLDGAKVKALAPQLSLSVEDRILMAGEVKNIGTAEKFYMFEGQRIAIRDQKPLKLLITQLWKKGDPTDGLIASIYKTDPVEPIWLPVGKHFTSQELSPSQLRSGPSKTVAVFNFDPPLELEQGVYYVVIYRTGHADDQNYYQVNSQHFAVK